MSSRISRHGAVIFDAMCGGGGSSLAIHRFVCENDVSVKRFVAINHDPDAIATHEANFPGVVHYCQDVGHVDLHEAFPDGYADFGWCSPTCTQHSRARGGRPIQDQLRNGPWQILTICTEIHVARLAIENVPEFVEWTVLDANGRPIKSRRGETYRAWQAAFEAIGYKFEWRITNAANYGAGTTRERYLGLATKKGRIYWAIPTHAPDGAGDLFHGYKERWVGARNFLDLNLPTKPVIGRKVPLAAPTLARGWHGMKQFWPAGAVRVYSPDIRDAAIEGIAYCNAQIAKAHTQLKAARRRKNPVKNAAKRRKALTARIARLTLGVERYQALLQKVQAYLALPLSISSGELQPFLVTLRGTSDSCVKSSASNLEEPMNGIVAGGGHLMLTAPKMESLVGGNRAHNVPKPETEPASGITTSTGGGLYLVRPALEPVLLGQHGGGIARPGSAPASTITQDGATSLFSGELDSLVLGQQSNAAARPSREPGPTIATAGAVSLFGAETESLLVQRYGDKHGKPRACRPGSEPAPSPTTTPNRFTLVQALIQPFYGEKAGTPRASRTQDQPLGTQTRENRFGILDPCLVQTNHTAEEQRAPEPVDEPVPYIATHNGLGIADGHLEETDFDLARLTPAIRERLLIGQDGRLHVARLHFRMLNPRIELAPVMGFPRDYKWPDSNTKITKLVGNAVNVEWAYAHVKAFLADWIPAEQSEEVSAA